MHTLILPAADLVYHPFHPRSDRVLSKDKIEKVFADYTLARQRFPLRGVIDNAGQILIHRDGGLLHLTQSGRISDDLRVEVWRLTDEQVVDDILQEEDRVVQLSYYERAITYAAYVEARGGCQRACYAQLGFQDESGLTKALAPVRLSEFLRAAVDDLTALQISTCATINAKLNDDNRSVVEALVADGGDQQPTRALVNSVRDLLVPKEQPGLVGPDRRGNFSFTPPGAKSPIARVRPVNAEKIEITLMTKASKREWSALGQAIASI